MGAPLIGLAVAAGVAAGSASFWVAAGWDRRLFAGDNALALVMRLMRFWPRLLPLKTRAEIDAAIGMMKAPIRDKVAQAGFSAETLHVPVEGFEIPVFVAKPLASSEGKLLPIIVWCHGGGMVIGEAEDAALTNTPPVGMGILNHFAGKAIICSVDYRLAPDFIFPTGPEDCIAVTRWLQANASQLGGDPERVSVGGLSAGGYCAANVHLAARDRGFPLTSVVMINPMLRRNTDSQSWREFGDMKGLPKAGMDWFWSLYAPDPKVASDPRCEPVRGVAAGGLAPCLVATSEFDGLRDEGVEHMEALRAAGVAVEHVRCRTSHVAAAADKERFALVLQWWSRSLGLAEPSGAWT